MPRIIMVGVTLHIFLFLLKASAVTYTCQDPSPSNLITVKETDAEGSVLFTMGENPDLFSWQFYIIWPASWRYLESYFSLVKDNKMWMLKLNKSLDVEAVFKEKGSMIDGKAIQVLLKCLVIGEEQWMFFSREITVEEVDEYPPKFITDIITLQIPEEQPVGSILLELNQFITDEDLKFPGLECARSFVVNALTPQLAPPDTRFRVTMNGTVVVNKIVDYEKSHNYSPMNVSVMQKLPLQNNSRESFIIIYISIYNVNDNAPIFMYLGCKDYCTETYYVAKVSGCYKGIVFTFRYGPINAVDLDNEPVEYRIVDASPNKAVNYVLLNKITARLEITDFLKDLDVSMLSFLLQAYDTRLLKTADGNWGENSRYTLLFLIINLDDCKIDDSDE